MLLFLTLVLGFVLGFWASEELKPRDSDERPLRGIVPTKIVREPLFSFNHSVKLKDLPRWKPKMTGDYGRHSHDD